MHGLLGIHDFMCILQTSHTDTLRKTGTKKHPAQARTSMKWFLIFIRSRRKEGNTQLVKEWWEFIS